MRACRADARRVELRPPACGREDPAPPCRGAPRRCASPRTRRGGRRPRSRRDDRGAAARRRSSTSPSSRSRSRAPTRATTCSTRSATTRSSVLPKAAVCPRRRRRTPSTTRHSPTRHVRSFVDATGRPGHPARARARQPLGRARIRPRCTGPGHRDPIGRARLVLRARGARLRRTSLRRTRAHLRVRGCFRRAPARVGRVPLLPRDGRARPRRGYRGRRTRARRDRAATAGVGSRRGGALARPRRIR